MHDTVNAGKPFTFDTNHPQAPHLWDHIETHSADKPIDETFGMSHEGETHTVTKLPESSVTVSYTHLRAHET